jgi:hypothetical protein
MSDEGGIFIKLLEEEVRLRREDEDRKRAEEYMATLNIHHEMGFDLRDRYFDANGKEVTFESIYLAGLEAGRGESKWIKCSERMPEKGVPVVARDSAGDMNLVNLTKESPAYFSYWDGCSCCSRFDGSMVTHWMPLPEGPEGES